jgi:DNA-binding NarL/FixJ family response regulator
MPGPLRVVIGEDDVLLREGISRLLPGASFDVVAQAGDAKDLLREGLAHRPSVVIADVSMPPGRQTMVCRRRSSSAASGPRRVSWCYRSSTRSSTHST